MDWFDKGEDIQRTAQLVIEGAVADTADFTDIEVKIFDWMTRHIATYSFLAGTVTKEAPTADGIISFIIPSATTLLSRLGKYFYQITTWETDVDFPGGVRIRRHVGYVYGLKYGT